VESAQTKGARGRSGNKPQSPVARYGHSRVTTHSSLHRHPIPPSDADEGKRGQKGRERGGRKRGLTLPQAEVGAASATPAASASARPHVQFLQALRPSAISQSLVSACAHHCTDMRNHCADMFVCVCCLKGGRVLSVCDAHTLIDLGVCTLSIPGFGVGFSFSSSTRVS
jgi:hypothetical protein